MGLLDFLYQNEKKKEEENQLLNPPVVSPDPALNAVPVQDAIEQPISIPEKTIPSATPKASPQEEQLQTLVQQAQSSPMMDVNAIDQRARDLRTLGMFANAGSTIGSALSLGAAKPVEIGNDLIKAADRELSDAKTVLDLNDEQAMRDPNSAVSKAMRDGLKTMFPNLKIPDNVSAQQLKGVGINLGTLTGIKESADARRDAASQHNQMMRIRQEELNLQKEQNRNDKLEKEQRLSDTQLKKISEYENPIRMLDSIISDKPNFDTGPIAGRWNTVASWVGLDDSKKSAFRSDVGDALAQYIKGISGAAVSENERRALMANLPNMNDNDKTFIAKAEATKRRLQQLKEVELSLLERQGKNISNFKSEVLTQESPRDKDRDAIEYAKRYNLPYEQAKKIVDKRKGL